MDTPAIKINPATEKKFTDALTKLSDEKLLRAYKKFDMYRIIGCIAGLLLILFALLFFFGVDYFSDRFHVIILIVFGGMCISGLKVLNSFMKSSYRQEIERRGLVLK